jgi:hypothetical protein
LALAKAYAKQSTKFGPALWPLPLPKSRYVSLAMRPSAIRLRRSCQERRKIAP